MLCKIYIDGVLCGVPLGVVAGSVIVAVDGNAGHWAALGIAALTLAGSWIYHRRLVREWEDRP